MNKKNKTVFITKPSAEGFVKDSFLDKKHEWFRVGIESQGTSCVTDITLPTTIVGPEQFK